MEKPAFRITTRSRQEWFDLAWNHAIVNKAKPSYRLEGYGTWCYYRHPDDPDCRCLIGCGIPDENYDPFMEGEAPRVLAKCSDYPLEDFLCALQDCHDGAVTTHKQFLLKGFPEQDFLDAYRKAVETALREFAIRHKLTISGETNNG